MLEYVQTAIEPGRSPFMWDIVACVFRIVRYYTEMAVRKLIFWLAYQTKIEMFQIEMESIQLRAHHLLHPSYLTVSVLIHNLFNWEPAGLGGDGVIFKMRQSLKSVDL